MKTYNLELTKPELTQLYHLLMDVKPRIQRNIDRSYSGKDPMWIAKIVKINSILNKVNKVKDYKLQDKLYKCLC